MFERFSCEVHMFGRRIRINEYDEIFTLCMRHSYPTWHKIKKKMRYVETPSGKDRCMVVQFMAYKDRYNQFELGRDKYNNHPPRTVAVSILLAVKYLSKGVDLGCKGYYVIHKDGNVINDSPENLEWVKKDDFISKSISKRIEKGYRIGLFEVLGSVERSLYHTQFGRDTNIGFSRLRCICGKEEEIRTAYLTSKSSCHRLCCKECLERIGKRRLRRILEEYGVLEFGGFRDKYGRRKMTVCVFESSEDCRDLDSYVKGILNGK